MIAYPTECLKFGAVTTIRRTYDVAMKLMLATPGTTMVAPLGSTIKH
jgi:hypothetical protein